MNLSSTDTREIRKFGTIAFIFFGALAGVGFWREKFLVTYIFGLLSITGLGFILFPGQLRPVFRLWLKLTHRIAIIITTIILTIAYYGIITPAAFLKRIFGGSPLPVKPDPDRDTYWVARSEPAQDKDRFIKRY